MILGPREMRSVFPGFLAEFVAFSIACFLAEFDAFSIVCYEF